MDPQCDDVPTETGFVNQTSGPVTFGDLAVYRCNDSNQVSVWVNSSTLWILNCDSSIVQTISVTVTPVTVAH